MWAFRHLASPVPAPYIWTPVLKKLPLIKLEVPFGDQGQSREQGLLIQNWYQADPNDQKWISTYSLLVVITLVACGVNRCFVPYRKQQALASKLDSAL